MLNKKQYWYTLLVAVVVFFSVFIITYFYMEGHAWHIESGESTQMTQTTQTETSQGASDSSDEVAILPHTRVTLRMQDTRTHQQSQTRLESRSLLGLTKDQLQEQFKDYMIETFNEKEVTLVKNYHSEVEAYDEEVTYVLGVEGNYVCIKEKDTNKRPVKIDYEINHFSKYIYSLLLNEEIVITSAQKEALLLNPSTLQKILQGYAGE